MNRSGGKFFKQQCNVGFSDVDNPDKLTKPKINIPGCVYVGYRIVVAVFFSCMFLARWYLAAIHPPEDQHFLVYNSTWAFICLDIYLCVALACVIQDQVSLQHVRSTWNAASSSSPDDEVQVLKAVRACDDSIGSTYDQFALHVNWLPSLAWFFWSIAAPAVLFSSITYFSVLYPDTQPVSHHILDVWRINEYVITMITVALELLLFSSFPRRLAHCFHVTAYAITYSMFYIVYWAMSKKFIYNNLINFSMHPTQAALVLVSSVIAINGIAIALFAVDEITRHVIRQATPQRSILLTSQERLDFECSIYRPIAISKNTDEILL